MSVLALFIAPDDRLAGWWLIEDDRVTGRGGGDDPLPGTADRVVAIAPADSVTLHASELGLLATQQAQAAARLLVAENSVAPVETQHVAVGAPDGADRAVAVVSKGRIEAWLAALQRHGLDPDAILPAPLLLPRPADGFVRATIGAETVLRGRTSGFADEPGLTPLIVGDAPVETLDAEPLVLRALADPELDLRQGPYARRRGFRVDWQNVRRLARLGGALVAATLLIALVQIVRLNAAASALEEAAVQTAQRAVPGGAGTAALDARLAARRGGGFGFTATAGALFAGVQAVPNVELAGLEFGADGLLRATVLAPGAAEAERLRDRLRAAGLKVEASTFTSEAGRIRGELRIGGR